MESACVGQSHPFALTYESGLLEPPEAKVAKTQDVVNVNNYVDSGPVQLNLNTFKNDGIPFSADDPQRNHRLLMALSGDHDAVADFFVTCSPNDLVYDPVSYKESRPWVIFHKHV
ncbi:hypothetical protein HDU93_002832 [Gonapodya sp. JEL0774]|nr:hypothetical protein HDU93_002832 [Gonapodya sp. JEL0774]